jgi:hypothetical protein
MATLATISCRSPRTEKSEKTHPPRREEKKQKTRSTDPDPWISRAHSQDPMCGYGGVSLDPKAYEDASPLALINENYKEGQLNPYPGLFSAFFAASDGCKWA